MPAENTPTRPPAALPTDTPEVFAAAALENMEHYSGVPYEIGRLIVNHVVDEKTRLMAYQVRDDYLDRGSSAAAFLVTEEGASTPDVLTASFTPAIAADHPLSKAAWRKETDERLEALRRGQGIEGHVQLKAADREYGLVITTRAPGKDIFDHRKPVEPNPEHWAKLRQTAKAMRRRRIGFDAVGGNIHWDPAEGFTIYDTHPVGLNPRKWVRPRKLVENARARVAIQNNRYTF
jgi:hypothetical protein